MRNQMWLVTSLIVTMMMFLMVGCSPREDHIRYEEDFCMETSGWDSDGDGIYNECDTCPLVGDSSNLDSDQDGWGDVCDPCPYDRFDRCQGLIDGDGDTDSDGDTDVDGDSDGDSDSDGDGDTDSDSDGDTGPRDHDGDGYNSSDDCDDTDSTVYPGASERCNGLDDDCDGVVDEGCDRDVDRDHDGFTVAEGDCNDTDPNIYPRAPERCNGVDDDCDGVRDEGCPVDRDRDTWPESEDCDDFDADIYPGADEVCDGVDNDCDGVVDEGCEDSCPECPSTEPEEEPVCEYWVAPGGSGTEVLYISGAGDVATVMFRCERGMTCRLYDIPANPEGPGAETFFVTIPEGYNGASPRSVFGGYHNLGLCSSRTPIRVFWTETSTGGYLALY